MVIDEAQGKDSKKTLKSKKSPPKEIEVPDKTDEEILNGI